MSEIEALSVSRNGKAPDDLASVLHPEEDLVAGRQILPQRVSEVEPERVGFVWEGRLPLRALSMIVGRQGLGKSTLALQLAAQLTRGTLPGNLCGIPSNVLVASLEDDVASTVLPRLVAAGADLEKVIVPKVLDDGRPGVLSLPADLDRLADAAIQCEAKLIVVDPLTATMGGVDSHKDSDLRSQILAPLAQLASEVDAALVGVLHLRKGSSNEPLDRVGGSVAFTAAPRSVLAFGRLTDDEDDDYRRALVHAKSNVGPLAPALAYKIEAAEVTHRGVELSTSRLTYEGETDLEAGELLNPGAPEDRTEVDIAGDWLADHLADGEWHLTAEIREQAKAGDIAARTLQRASKKLKVEVDRFAPEGVSGRGSAVGHWRLSIAAPPSEKAVGATTPGAIMKPLGNAESANNGALSRQSAAPGATIGSEPGCAAHPDGPAEGCRYCAATVSEVA